MNTGKSKPKIDFLPRIGPDGVLYRESGFTVQGLQLRVGGLPLKVCSLQFAVGETASYRLEAESY
jgi:hypothetical protein